MTETKLTKEFHAVLGNPNSSVACLSRKLARKNKTLKEGYGFFFRYIVSPLVAEKGTYTVTSNIEEVESTFVE